MPSAFPPYEQSKPDLILYLAGEGSNETLPSFCIKPIHTISGEVNEETSRLPACIILMNDLFSRHITIHTDPLNVPMYVVLGPVDVAVSEG